MPDPNPWKARWEEGRIGFHRAEVHADLIAYNEQWLGDDAQRVFVPLCGKSLDLMWLADRGHDVIGVELSDLAVRAFFDEEGIDATRSRDGAFEVYRAGRITIYCGDYFELMPEHVRAERVWDRASMIALPRDVRSRYVAHLRTLMTPDWKILLNVLEYDESVMEGPPFSVTDDEVRAHYANCWIRPLHRRDMLDDHWRELGHEKWVGSTYTISP